jgi:uncharacterized protein (DUF2336 family)
VQRYGKRKPLSLENLTHFGLRAGVDMRPTLIRVLTDLYVQKLTHTPDEERHYTELALRLLDAVDVASRVAVAERLARHLAPPLRVIQRLAADRPEIAAPVRSHPVLHRKQQPEPAAAPAPAAVSEPVTDAAATVAEVIEAVAEVAEADLPDADEREEKIEPSAVTHGMIAADVASELNELFFAASAYERRLILLNLEIVAPVPAGRAALARDASIGLRLETAALTRNREDFAQHLALALQIPRAQARRIVGDELGEPIVIVARALNIPRDVVYRILLFVNTTVGHSVERVHALATLYDEMTPQTAEHVVAIWQSLRKAERPTVPYRPLHWNDEARARVRVATATVRRAPATQRPSERRDVS